MSALAQETTDSSFESFAQLFEESLTRQEMKTGSNT